MKDSTVVKLDHVTLQLKKYSDRKIPSEIPAIVTDVMVDRRKDRFKREAIDFRLFSFFGPGGIGFGYNITTCIK